MIKPTDVELIEKHDASGQPLVTVFAHLELTYSAMRPQRELDEGEAARECRVRLWDHVYGDLHRALGEMRRELMVAVGFDGGARADAAIRKVEKLVENPFYMPGNSK